MKRTFVLMFLTFALVSVYSQTGVIRELAGEVGLKQAGAEDFTAAQAGSEVAQDTVVSTGFRSTAIITVGSTTITVRPLTRLTLAEISSAAETEKLNVNLQTGRVRVEVKPPAGSKASVTTVQSPSATASVRGTVFEMDARNLNVIEGKVGFAGNNGFPVMVQGGYSSEVLSDGAEAADPIAITEADLTPPPPGVVPFTGGTPLDNTPSGGFGVNVIVTRGE